MLKEILAITGKPGLFKIISHSGKSLIVEEITTGKKLPVSPRDRVISLADVAMYTDNGERPLSEILDVIYTQKNGEQIDMKEVKDNLKETFASFVPDYDKDRVHDSDVRKLFNWYNLLVANGLTQFKEEEQKEEDTEKESGEEKPTEQSVS
ncbi:MAG: DUF5606 domain-containing protein [Muribaculaceae bacterium]|nr:DUF5606 domain-containing protein [Muribaculaceae bacterium]